MKIIDIFIQKQVAAVFKNYLNKFLIDIHQYTSKY